MPEYAIPFNKPSIEGNELTYITEALQAGHISGDGVFTKKCQEFFQRELAVPRALLTSSCTHALEMAALLLDLQAGDEIVLPSFTFVSTANAFALRGARPVFADIRRDTLNLDETRLTELVTDRTKAIVPVHYGGVACEMDTILNIAGDRGIAVVEDSAHGLYGRYKGKQLGTFGRMATLSFHETKNVTCGEGGALLLNSPADIERAEVIREKGTNRSKFFRGEVDKYTWVGLGSSYLPSDVTAAFLYGQLEFVGHIMERRARIWHRYHAELQDWATNIGATLPTIPAHCDSAYHLFYMLLPSEEFRARLIDHLKSQGILSVFHYLPLHLSEMGRQFGGKPGDCPVTEDISERLLRLPFYNAMTAEEQSRVIDAVRAFD